MDALQELKEAHENKFKHEQDVLFKAKIRRNKLVGLWAAELMELSDSDAEKYAEELSELHIKDTGRDRLQVKIVDDFTRYGVHKSEHRIERQIHDFMLQALESVKSE
ncbi:ATPase inhibitor subunit zeta [Kiloniella majae]|uniref:ATPase inhibitor subunit zeta n=1 Tax=Kiloniella majae TaxID=1938558 RepID=UPI000A278F1E|nr:ATPase inhibitor subunit zeta [Kiloniella majae]